MGRSPMSKFRIVRRDPVGGEADGGGGVGGVAHHVPLHHRHHVAPDRPVVVGDVSRTPEPDLKGGRRESGES